MIETRTYTKVRKVKDGRIDILFDTDKLFIWDDIKYAPNIYYDLYIRREPVTIDMRDSINGIIHINYEPLGISEDNLNVIIEIIIGDLAHY